MKEGPLGSRKSHERSRMRLHGAVTVDDVLSVLVARTAHIESSTGPQLEILRVRNLGGDSGWFGVGTGAPFADYGVSLPKLPTRGDPWSAMDRAELAIGRDIGVVRCVRDFCTVADSELHTPFLSPLVAKTGRGLGELVIACLRAYCERATQSHERALAEVWVWATRLEGVEEDAAELAQRFRAREGAATRRRAMALHAECMRVLLRWVMFWNARK